MGLSLAKLEKFGQAINAYDRAIDLEPEYLDPWNNKGIALVMGSEDYVEALKCFDRAIKIDPNSMEAWVNKGNALKLDDRGTESNTAFEKAKKLGYLG